MTLWGQRLGPVGFPPGELLAFRLYVCILYKANPHNHLKSQTNLPLSVVTVDLYALGHWCSRNNLLGLKSRQWGQWDGVFGPSSSELSRSWNIFFPAGKWPPLPSLTGKRAWWDSFGFPQWKPVLWAFKPEERSSNTRVKEELLRFQPVWGAHGTLKKDSFKTGGSFLKDSHKLYPPTLWIVEVSTLNTC